MGTHGYVHLDTREKGYLWHCARYTSIPRKVVAVAMCTWIQGKRVSMFMCKVHPDIRIHPDIKERDTYSKSSCKEKGYLW